MERLTEYQWEERKRDREAFVQYQLTGAALAEHDRKEFDVEHESGAYAEWREIAARRYAAGWELCSYGNVGTLFIISGYFRRRKQPPTPSPASPG